MSTTVGEADASLEKQDSKVDLASSPIPQEPDAEFGGTAARAKLERKLLWKIDLRMSILVIIYMYVAILVCGLHPRLMCSCEPA
jgi:hypothetical protein